MKCGSKIIVLWDKNMSVVSQRRFEKENCLGYEKNWNNKTSVRVKERVSKRKREWVRREIDS